MENQENYTFITAKNVISQSPSSSIWTKFIDYQAVGLKAMEYCS